MFTVYNMYEFEEPYVVKLHCEERQSPMLCISDRVPPFVMMSFDEAYNILTPEDFELLRHTRKNDRPINLPGSKLKLRYYIALLCNYYEGPIAIHIKAPDVFLCVAMSVKCYNHRVGADAAITEDHIAKAMESFPYKEEK